MDLSANLCRFSGFADEYDQYCPQPPAVIPEILTCLAGETRPKLVVDLGSGTGLSTHIWAGRADEVIGVEPDPDMRRQAAARSAALSCAGVVRHFEGDSTFSLSKRLWCTTSSRATPSGLWAWG